MNEKKSSKSKSSKKHPRLIYDVSLSLIIIIFAISGSIAVYYNAYSEGLSNNKSFLEGFVIFCLFIILSIFFLLILCLRMFILRKKYYGKQKYMVTIFLIISILSILFSNMLLQPEYKPFSKGLAKKMKNEADIPAIRIWLDKIKDKYDDLDSIKEDDFPSTIKILSPVDVWLMKEKESHVKVCLKWGGGFVQWGIIIGPEDMEIPPSNFEEHGEYRLPIAPGAYVWHEIG